MGFEPRTLRFTVLHSTTELSWFVVNWSSFFLFINSAEITKIVEGANTKSEGFQGFIIITESGWWRLSGFAHIFKQMRTYQKSISSLWRKEQVTKWRGRTERSFSNEAERVLKYKQLRIFPHYGVQFFLVTTRLKILSSVWPRVIFFVIRDDFLETIFLETILPETILVESIFLKTILHETILVQTIFLKTILLETILVESTFLKTILLNFVQLCWQLMSTNLSNYVGFLPITLEYTSVQLRWNLSNYVGIWGSRPKKKKNNNNFSTYRTAKAKLVAVKKRDVWSLKIS